MQYKKLIPCEVYKYNFQCYVSLGGSCYYIKTKADDLAHKILRTLKIPSPKNITSAEELNL
jgi:hypothetical protein